MNEVFGNYRLVERIGGGGLGEVFRAEAEDGAVLALKRLAAQHRGNADYCALFAQETKTAGELGHALLLGALDSGSVDDWPYLVSRLAEDGSLRQELADQLRLPKNRLAKTIVQIGEAVAALHSLGYAHSDLSPGNVLFHKGVAHLTDFGSSTPLGAKQPRPQGTYAYMSPEQVRGEALDRRSDLFSISTLLWQCASGERIFWRDAQHLTFMAVVDAVLPPLPDELLPVEALLRSGLDKDPNKRPDDVAAFCQELASGLQK